MARRLGARFRTFTAAIQLSRFTSNGKPSSGWSLRVEDTASHTTILEVQMTDAEFGAAVGHSYTKCEGARKAEFYSGRYIGCKLETKTVELKKSAMPDRDGDLSAEARAAIAEVENNGDGWFYDCTTNRDMALMFRRYVDAAGVPVTTERDTAPTLRKPKWVAASKLKAGTGMVEAVIAGFRMLVDDTGAWELHAHGGKILDGRSSGMVDAQREVFAAVQMLMSVEYV